jgi:hypothetical protein
MYAIYIIAFRVAANGCWQNIWYCWKLLCLPWLVQFLISDQCRTKEPTWNEDFTLNIRKSLENLLQVWREVMCAHSDIELTPCCDYYTFLCCYCTSAFWSCEIHLQYTRRLEYMVQILLFNHQEVHKQPINLVLASDIISSDFKHPLVSQLITYFGYVLASPQFFMPFNILYNFTQ